MLYYDNYSSEVGPIAISAEDCEIVSIEFGKKFMDVNKCVLIDEVKLQLDKYFSKEEVTFDFCIKIKGSDFYRKVIDIVRKIPYGNTLTYLEIANLLGNSNYARAVGNAVHNNQIMILVPCHRVVGKKDIYKYKYGKNIKKKLLEIEGVLSV